MVVKKNLARSFFHLHSSFGVHDTIRATPAYSNLKSIQLFCSSPSTTLARGNYWNRTTLLNRFLLSPFIIISTSLVLVLFLFNYSYTYTTYIYIYILCSFSFYFKTSCGRTNCPTHALPSASVPATTSAYRKPLVKTSTLTACLDATAISISLRIEQLPSDVPQHYVVAILPMLRIHIMVLFCLPT